MGARQSKRSVDISSTPKKGDLDNGTVTGTEEKLEKIEEGESAVMKVNANGSTTTTSTVTAEQQEAASSVPESSTVTSTETESVVTKVDSEETQKNEETSSPNKEGEKEEPASPTSPSEQHPEEASSEKKKKSKKKWSFRSFSFSKKDRVKHVPKEEKQETVPEDNEGSTQQTEQVNPEVSNVSCVQNEEPPPLPKSPPPTPAEEEPAPAEKEETPIISEGDVDASGGGEGLAEPIEEAELEVSTSLPNIADQPLTNGVSDLNGSIEINGKLTEEEELISPVDETKASVDSVTVKIGSLKLQITSDSTEAPSQNGVDETSPVEQNGLDEKADASLEKAVVEN